MSTNRMVYDHFRAKDKDGRSAEDQIAFNAYEMADAMLRRRSA